MDIKRKMNPFFKDKFKLNKVKIALLAFMYVLNHKTEIYNYINLAYYQLE